MWVYMITNNISNKKYIGITTNIKKRLCEHFKPSNKSCPALRAAINKYGKKSFQVCILKECKSVDELNIWEMFYIDKYNSISPTGYKLEYGGGSTGTASEEKKKNQREAYNKNPELRKIVGESSKQNWNRLEYKELLSKKRKDMWKNPEYRVKMSKIRNLM